MERNDTHWSKAGKTNSEVAHLLQSNIIYNIIYILHYNYMYIYISEHLSVFNLELYKISTMDPQILAVFSPIFSHQLGLPGNELTVIHVENRQLKYLGG